MIRISTGWCLAPGLGGPRAFAPAPAPDTRHAKPDLSASLPYVEVGGLIISGQHLGGGRSMSLQAASALMTRVTDDGRSVRDVYMATARAVVGAIGARWSWQRAASPQDQRWPLRGPVRTGRSSSSRYRGGRRHDLDDQQPTDRIRPSSSEAAANTPATSSSHPTEPVSSSTTGTSSAATVSTRSAARSWSSRALPT